MNIFLKGKKFTCIIMAAATCLFVLAFSFIYDAPTGEVIRNTVAAITFSLGLVYLYIYSCKTNRLDYNNLNEPLRFLILYLAGLILSMIYPLINVEAWIFLAFAIALSFFSNQVIGMYSITGLIIFSALLSRTSDICLIVVYILSSFIGIMLFCDIDESFKVEKSVAISVMILFLLELGGMVITLNEEFSVESLLLPILNVTVNIVFLIVFLKNFNKKTVNIYMDSYQILNDQSYMALVKLKELSPADYFRSIHTAYLAERMAKATSSNVNLTKNLAYYFRVKDVFNFTDGQFETFLIENNFPPEAAKLLLDYLGKNSDHDSKEAGIVYISDKIITSLTEMINKGEKTKVDYDKFFDEMFDRDKIIETFKSSDLSVKDFYSIKKIATQETLYYDFLR